MKKTNNTPILSSDNHLKELTDNFNRTLNYLRLAVTDRCNLRCSYCMPVEGVDYIHHNNILSFEEALTLIKIFSELGIRKIRLTGGEPFVRKGFPEFLESIKHLENSPSIHITTNGVLTGKYIKTLNDVKIAGINLSLDTLQKNKFISLTGRDNLTDVLHSLDKILNAGIPLKVNTVIQKHFNADEIPLIATLARENNIEVRFIEQMPFNGSSAKIDTFSGKEICAELEKAFGKIYPESGNSSTAEIFRVEGFKGRLGIIGGYSRSFCGSCNRLRITSTGIMKNCLYDDGVLNLRDLLRSGASDDEIKNSIIAQTKLRFENGFIAEMDSKSGVKNSMSLVGG